MNRAIHALKKDAGLDEEIYRGLLHAVLRKDSLKAASEEEMRAVLARLKMTTPKRKPIIRSVKGYVRKIHAIWGDLARRGVIRAPFHKRGSALVVFVRSMTGVDSPEWLTAYQANKVIEALKAMQARTTNNTDMDKDRERDH
ncbi:MAG: regulatory protein GemA [Pseudomonadota bacterium]